MEEILQEMKGSIGGLIGSFVIGENGDVTARDIPEKMNGSVDKVSKTLHHVSNVIKSTRPFDKMVFDSESAKVIALNVDGRILAVIAEKGINQALFRLMSNMAASKIKESTSKGTDSFEYEKVDEVKIGPPVTDIEKEEIKEIYTAVFNNVSKRLLIVVGPIASRLLNDKLKLIKKEKPELLKEVEFGSNAHIDLERLLDNADSISKAELRDNLDEIVSKMIEAIRSNAGPKIAEKTISDVLKIKRDFQLNS